MTQTCDLQSQLIPVRSAMLPARDISPSGDMQSRDREYVVCIARHGKWFTGQRVQVCDHKSQILKV